MKITFKRCIAAFTLLSSPGLVNAANELVVNINEAGNAASGLLVVLDSGVEKAVESKGMLYFDLSPGGHSLQLKQGESTLHTVRFNAAKGQFVDINVDLSDAENPRSVVENYFAIETASQRAGAATGVVGGRISVDGVPLVGAVIELQGTKFTTTTDANGAYRLEVPRGIYTVVVKHDEIGERETTDFRVVSNVEKQANLAFAAAEPKTSATIEEIVVMGSMQGSAFLDSERFSSNVVNTLGIEKLARFGDADVASAVVRAPSVTVQDSQYVFIRGLGDRYVSATLNGATLPSTNPSKRTVPLDLFPSNLVEQLDIRKTFIASMPGESTGGNLVINTRTFPSEEGGKLSVSLGYVDGITGEQVYVDPLRSENSFEFLGWDDGARDTSGTAKAVSKVLDYKDFYPVSVQNELGRVAALSIKDNFHLDQDKATPNLSLGINYGDGFYIENIDGELGYFVAANYKNGWSQKTEGIERSYGGDDFSRIEDDFEFEKVTNEISLSGLISIGLNVGNSTYESNTLVSRVTESSVNYKEGEDGDAGEPSIRWTIEWEERQFVSQQFTGEHVVGENEEWTLDWQGTISQAQRYAPDRREVRFDLTDTTGIYELQRSNVYRQYDELTDDNSDIAANARYNFAANGGWDSELSFGVQLISRERDSDSDSFGFTGGQSSVDEHAPNLLVSDVINGSTITGNTATGYTFQDKTLPSDSYEADMDLNSLYTSLDTTWDSKYQLIVGVRYEDFEQTTDTFLLQGAQEATQSNIDEKSTLPSLSFNWFYKDDEQLRFAISRTVARPDFKEASNAVFYDDEDGARIRGNPDLKISDVTNFDIRWEKYWSDLETLSVALFYKDMTDPIERVVQNASGTAGNTRTFKNVDSADVTGIEVDGRVDFPLNDGETQSIFVSGNASILDTEVSLIGGEKRNLQGAPDYTVNLILGYDDIENGHEVTLLFNQNGDTITDVGVNGLPNVIEEPRLVVDVNYKYHWSEELIFKVKAKNILDKEVERTQGGNIYRQYKKGMELSAGFDWNF